MLAIKAHTYEENSTGSSGITIKDLLDLDGPDRHELINGQVVIREQPKPKHGAATVWISMALGKYVRDHNLGIVTAESGYILRRNPDTVRGPDVAFVKRERLPNGIPDGYIEGGPDLAVEILSQSNRWKEMEDKIAQYFAAGTSIVWLADVVDRKIIIRKPDCLPRTLSTEDDIDGEELVPGFRARVGDLR